MHTRSSALQLTLVLLAITGLASTAQAAWWAEVACFAGGTPVSWMCQPEHETMQEAIATAFEELEAQFGPCEDGTKELLQVGETEVGFAAPKPSGAISGCKPYHVQVCLCIHGTTLKYRYAPVSCCCDEAKRIVHQHLCALQQQGACFRWCVLKDCGKKRHRLFGFLRR